MRLFDAHGANLITLQVTKPKITLDIFTAFQLRGLHTLSAIILTLLIVTRTTMMPDCGRVTMTLMLFTYSIVLLAPNFPMVLVTTLADVLTGIPRLLIIVCEALSILPTHFAPDIFLTSERVPSLACSKLLLDSLPYLC